MTSVDAATPATTTTITAIGVTVTVKSPVRAMPIGRLISGEIQRFPAPWVSRIASCQKIETPMVAIRMCCPGARASRAMTSWPRQSRASRQ